MKSAEFDENAESKIAPVKLPLHEVLLANGYEIDREKSTSRNPVLKSNGGYKFNALPCYDSNKHPYLKNRSIDCATIDNYAKNIKVDKHFNVYFPQYSLVEDRNNIFVRGYTMKLATHIYKDKDGKPYEKPIKSLTKGEKGLEILMPNDTSNIKSVILAESSIDTLSFAEIANVNNAVLIATSGNTKF